MPDDETPDATPPDDLTVAVVAAVADDGVIGRDGGMPWHYPEDLRHFRETTTGHPVVLGRRTYESIVDRLGEPLPERTNVVLTSQDIDLPEGATAVGSVDAALEAARDSLAERHPDAEATVYVAGGATVYEQFLPRADRLVITEVHDDPAGDTYFPEVDWSAWREVDRDERDDISFVTYERR
jgi:dihydrofolate reductase